MYSKAKFNFEDVVYLHALRYIKYKQLMATQSIKGKFKIFMLPPTEDATVYHILYSSLLLSRLFIFVC